MKYTNCTKLKEVVDKEKINEKKMWKLSTCEKLKNNGKWSYTLSYPHYPQFSALFIGLHRFFTEQMFCLVVMNQ